MPLPAPNLDDRRFQDLVDEAKRRVQQRCPEWTDHNVSDPGVTLIETFAFMVEQLLYRLNRVPDLHYVKFLDLIGLRLYPPTAARADVTFWLSAPQEEDVIVPSGAQVASVRTDVEEPVVFTTERRLRMVRCSLDRVATASATSVALADRTDDLAAGAGLACFGDRPAPGDAVYFGLTAAVPDCAVLLRVDCSAEGVGVDPRRPPWVWQAWSEAGWTDCEVDQDATGGFNRPGDVLLHVPADHVESVLGRHRAGWLRCAVVEARAGQPAYQNSPRIRTITAATVGGTVSAVHAEIVRDETAGVSDGVPGQRFPLAHPVMVAPDQYLVAGVLTDGGWQEWQEVPSFAQSGPADRHLMVDRVAGEVVFGPAIREPDGRLTQFGAIPPKGAAIRIPEYRTGGGRRGNVARDILQVQRDPVPFVSTVTNRRPARGGVDGESVSEAVARGPLLLRTRDRAVTLEDYEQLTKQAAPDAARVRCIPVDGAADAVRVLVVPDLGGKPRPDLADLAPDEGLLARIVDHLEPRRCIGARVSVEPPYYQGVTVVAQIVPAPRTDWDALREAATQALYEYLHPVCGGPAGAGWPFGRPVHSGEIFAALQRVPGVDRIEEIRLYGADPHTGQRGGAVQRLDLDANALVCSYGHQVRIVRG
ncbi:MAG: putative baseplate assembly protein [Micromonosporaceae bacterium]|nr:putative baseplate assembly protein [Micromonosporaceae bacterium]